MQDQTSFKSLCLYFVSLHLKDSFFAPHDTELHIYPEIALVAQRRFGTSNGHSLLHEVSIFQVDLISLRSELERTRNNVHNDLQGVKYALYGYKGETNKNYRA